MNILVTGGAGFVGRAFVEGLEADPDVCVVVLDDLSATGRTDVTDRWYVDTASRWRSDVPVLVVGDVRDRPTVRAALAGAHAVVHLAAQTGVPGSVDDPVHDFDVNAAGTLNVLEAARHDGTRRVVLASSGAVLGTHAEPALDTTPPRPVSPYGASKLTAESYARAYWSTYGLETAALRFSNAYGPGSPHKTSVVAEFCRAAVQGRPLTVNGSGDQVRDFIFVDDVVRAIRAAIESPAAIGEVFQIATGVGTSVAELAHMVAEAAHATRGVRPPVHHGAPRAGDVPISVADITKARELLGFRPEVALEDGVRLTLADFRAGR